MAWLTHLKKYTTVILWLLACTAIAQTALVNEAEKEYRAGDFNAALPMYKQLVKKYRTNSKFNHRYGVCLYETKENYDLALKHLKYARSKGIRLSNLYIGHILYQQYKFNQANEAYQKYLQSTKQTNPNYEWVKSIMKSGRELQRYLERTEVVELLRSQVVSDSLFFTHYSLSNESGRVLNSSDFFAGSDTAFAMYMNEREDRVCYPRILNDTLDTDLFQQHKLLDAWGNEENLGPKINSEGNELYPYFLEDGITLYFSSNGHGGLGGYDIFVTRYNPETKQFMPPTNLGMPFNSIGDDFLYVEDEYSSVGWFASNRNNKDGEITVYTFKPSKEKKILKASNEELIKAARLIVGVDSVAQESVAKNATSTNKPSSHEVHKPIYFVVNDTIIYRSTDQFVSAAALQLFKFGEMRLTALAQLKTELSNERERYGKLKEQEERDAAASRIVALEEEIFKLDSKSEDPFTVARNKELQVLKASNWELYHGVDYDQILSENLDLKTDIVHPEFYVPSVAAQYSDIFDMDEIDTLLEFEQIIAKEQATLDELQSAINIFAENDNLDQTTTYFWRKLRSIDTAFSYNKDKEALLNIGKQNLKIWNDQLLHTKLEKNNVIHQKVNLFASNTDDINAKMNIMEFVDKGMYFTSEVNSYLNKVDLNNQSLEQLQTLVPKTAKGQEMLEYAILYYVEDFGGPLHFEEDTLPLDSVVQDSLHADTLTLLTDTRDSATVEKEEIAPRLVYKVQIGIFSQPPSEKLLSQLSHVETRRVEGKKITKYYTGIYTVLDDARKMAKEADKIGFKGAFVVPFIEGKAVSWKEAKAFK